MKNLFRFYSRALMLTAILMLGIASTISAQAISRVAIIDAGSSGSRLYVYSKEGQTVKEETSHQFEKLKLSDYEPENVEEYWNKIKDKLPLKVNLYILATAGMREKEMVQSNRLYANIKKLSSEEFPIIEAKTISGAYEGVYAWIAANWDNADGRIDLAKTKGIIEIGGASMQVTFLVNDPKGNNIITHFDKNFYSKSYLGGGANKVYDYLCENYANDVDTLGYPSDGNYGLNVEQPECLPKNMTFWGLGGAFGDALAQGRDTADKIEAYGNDAKNGPVYKSKTNAYYIAHVINAMKIDGRIAPLDGVSWTKGKAIDVLFHMNSGDDDDFNYSRKN